MNVKQKFYLLLALFQIVLVFTIFFSVDGIIGIVSAQTGTNFDYFNSPTSTALAIGSALAVGFSVIASGIAIKTVGTAAISAVSEREGTFTKAFLIVALCEALAIYGLIVAVLLWTKIPSPV
ncbi:MAG: hypothetical protein KGD63_14635 [Candidatus Lokiarchaeota archaeon]|nr:hypothetical protein [Candidatus Lokiarchaeota archaeon]